LKHIKWKTAYQFLMHLLYILSITLQSIPKFLSKEFLLSNCKLYRNRHKFGLLHILQRGLSALFNVTFVFKCFN
jgi:hypothetical protein